MCGIAGAVGFVDDRVVEAVRAMDGVQRHRGPDAEGFWADEGHSVALAHRRLAILDLTDAGAQPMIEPQSGCVIVFNGEVYNFTDIREQLQRHGWTFDSHCDTEVILKAYVQWGGDCVERFRGMFAYAIWDPRNRQLHLARDRVGIKPLYLASIPRPGGGATVLFASELRAILAGGLVEPKLDPQGLGTYLWNGFVYGPSTMVRGVTLLPAGTRMTIDVGRPAPSPQRYWQLPRDDGSRSSVDELRAELEAAVKLRLIADVPLGVFLSGGVDSSAVAALACRAGGGAEAIHTFTIGFEQAQYDESPYAEAVARALGTTHRCIRLSESSFRDQLDDALRSIDQPTFDAINTYFVSRAVREAGVTVALAGTGGDELFGGYRSFADLPGARAWARRLAWAPRPLVRGAARAMARLKAGPAVEGLPPQTRWGKLADAFDTRGDLTELYQVAYGLFTAEFLGQLHRGSAAVANGSAGAVRFGLPAERQQALAQLIADQPTAHAISLLELSSFIGERLMRDTDAASMAVALEVRVPLLDHRVIETVARIDATTRFAPVRSKRLLRELALGDLDPALFDRPKSGFVLPIDTWLRQSLRDTMAQVFHDKGAAQMLGLDGDALSRLWRAFDAGAPGVYWSRIWAIFVLLHWCRTFNITSMAVDAGR